MEVEEYKIPIIKDVCRQLNELSEVRNPDMLIDVLWVNDEQFIKTASNLVGEADNIPELADLCIKILALIHHKL